MRDGKQDGFLREYGHPIFAHTGADTAYAAVFNEAMTSYSTGETQIRNDEVCVRILKNMHATSPPRLVIETKKDRGGEGHVLPGERRGQ